MRDYIEFFPALIWISLLLQAIHKHNLNLSRFLSKPYYLFLLKGLTDVIFIWKCTKNSLPCPQERTQPPCTEGQLQTDWSLQLSASEVSSWSHLKARQSHMVKPRYDSGKIWSHVLLLLRRFWSMLIYCSLTVMQAHSLFNSRLFPWVNQQ